MVPSLIAEIWEIHILVCLPIGYHKTLSEFYTFIKGSDNLKDSETNKYFWFLYRFPSHYRSKKRKCKGGHGMQKFEIVFTNQILI